MRKYTVTLHIGADLALDVRAEDDRAAWDAAREELVRRFVASGLGSGGAAELRIGRYSYQIDLSLDHVREAEVVDVEEADFGKIEFTVEQPLTAEERIERITADS